MKKRKKQNKEIEFPRIDQICSTLREKGKGCENEKKTKRTKKKQK